VLVDDSLAKGMHARTHTHAHARARTYMHTYIRTYMHTYVHTYIHTHINTPAFEMKLIYMLDFSALSNLQIFRIPTSLNSKTINMKI
jgi:hypothetical protein